MVPSSLMDITGLTGIVHLQKLLCHGRNLDSLAGGVDGKHLDDPFFQILKAKEIRIKSPEPFVYQADGENYHGDSLDIKILEKSLKLKI